MAIIMGYDAEAQRNDFTPTARYTHQYAAFMVDESTSRVLLVDGENTKATVVPFSDVLGCEVFQNNVATGGIGRSIAGAIIAGPVGAIVGALTSKKIKVTDFRIVIYLNSFTTSQVTYRLITSPIDTGNRRYKEAVSFADNVRSAVGVIVAKNQR